MYQNLPRNWNEREALREKGQFWTPRWISEAMTAYVINNTDLVFDPATGKGAFFSALLNICKYEIDFWGIDIDPNVLEENIYCHNRCRIERRDFIKNPPKRKFKSIIANPPYIRHHRIDLETKNFLKRLSLDITGQAIDGRAGLHVYFLIQALNLLEVDGKLAFIIPADTCEGKFSKNLWKWISTNFCIECVITFDESATPFPKVDTNAIIVLIKKAIPINSMYWVKCDQVHQTELLEFISSGFKKQDFTTIKIINRDLKEAISTGLSRPLQNCNDYKFYLRDFASVKRGIATGSNDFFFMTREKAQALHIPFEFLQRAVGRTKDIKGNTISLDDLAQLELENRPTFLLSLKEERNLPLSIIKYLSFGESIELPNRPLIKQRNPWYKMEQRTVPALLFAYLGRRNSRFIKNDAKVLPLTCFLCVYPISSEPDFIQDLWLALNHSETIQNLKLVGKSYGSGAIKVEPSNLINLPIPNHVVKNFNLDRKLHLSSDEQLELFRI